MFALQKRLYAWELEQARAFKIYVLALLGMILFVNYKFAKLLFMILVFLFEKPRLVKKVAPGKFEEIEHVHKGQIGF